MWFRMLGPLEVVSGGRSIDLGGSKQRATLGFLLLQPGQVVPTSRLLRALWSVEDAPATARKILQNAVWGLRRRLSVEGEEASVTLRTQAPGYSLEVRSEQVDLHLFNQLVEEGRTHLAAGAPDKAALQLRDALKLWRGTVLSDLVEVGFMWPELTTVQNTRLDVLEDYFEAQLDSGRHYAVLGELDALVESEPLRERSCGQLMRALYRCSRQADALGVYSRLRTALVEDLGLEPSRELQVLQQAILMQDPTLQFTPPATVAHLPAPVLPAATTPEDGMPERATAPATATTLPPSAVRPVLPSPRTAPDVSPVREEITVLQLSTVLNPETGHTDDLDIDAVLDRTATRVRREIEERGGTVAASMGADTLALFPAGQHPSDHAERAVLAAIALRTAFACDAGATMPGDVVLRAAIVTGEALVRRSPEGGSSPLSASGALLHEGQALLPLVPDGEIQVCPETREATQDDHIFTQPVGSPLRWQLRPATTDAVASGYGYPEIGVDTVNGGELDMLHSLLAHSIRWGRPHLVTVVGSSGTTRGRTLMDFRRIAAEHPGTAQVLFLCEPPTLKEGRFALHRAVLSAYCGLTGQDSPQTARGKIEATLRRAVDDPGRANWLASRLGPFVDPSAQPAEGFGTGDWLDGWYQFLETAAKERVLVLVIDELHLADDMLLDLIESLTDPGRRLPVLVIGGATPELLIRRPTLASGHGYTTVLSMESQVADVVIDPLLGPLGQSPELSRVGGEQWDGLLG